MYHEWIGFGPQKNYGLTLAKGDWIFWLDADEEVTPELAAAVKQAIQSGDADGYRISRLSWFCGQPMRHSGWHPGLRAAPVPPRQGPMGGRHEP